MDIGLKVQDIVLLGLFNPAKFDRYTFIKNKILKEEEIEQSSIFLPEIVNLQSKKFNLVINSNQIIISTNPENNVDISKFLLKFLSLFDEINLNASGFNFRYFVEPKIDNSEIESFIKKNFFNPNNKIQSQFFSDDNSTYGFYSSKDFKDTRLKLDVKPVNLNVQNLNLKSVQFEFNFHKDYDLKSNSFEKLKELLNCYIAYKNECKNIVNSLL